MLSCRGHLSGQTANPHTGTTDRAPLALENHPLLARIQCQLDEAGVAGKRARKSAPSKDR